MLFADRVDAGQRLAAQLSHLRGEDAVVVGLPRGGVPVAFQVARALRAPLDVLVVRKLGVPYQRELAMGALGEGGVRVLNSSIVAEARVTPEELAAVEDRERVELARRITRFRGDRPQVSLVGKTVVVVDDGIATGSTARAACQVARAQGAARVVLAVPVAPPGRVLDFGDVADEVVCLETPPAFLAIGEFYDNFSQTTDREVVELLARAAADRGPAGPEHGSVSGGPASRDEEVDVVVGRIRLSGHLTAPAGARGVVVFAHGSGSSRHSPRNRFVASVLDRAGLATLLFDLLTPDEERNRRNVFDIHLLASRLADVTAWLRGEPGMRDAAIGYFGASTGAGAALWAAAAPDSPVSAVVSRGGRPDLAAPRLADVRAPTLLVVGGRDDVVLRLNQEAKSMMVGCEVELAVVPGATHLFEEPGTLEAAADLARDWFVKHLCA